MDLEPSSCGMRRTVAAMVGALLAHAALALSAPASRLPPAREPSAPLVWLEQPAPVQNSVEASASSSRAPAARAAKPRARRIARSPAPEAPSPDATTSAAEADPELRASASAATETGPAAMVATRVSPHGPALLPATGSCGSHFPRRARVDHGEVQILVDVDATGHARVRNVVAEHPNGQGFDAAARSCTANLRFDPAIDANGVKVGGHATLRLRFARRRA